MKIQFAIRFLSVFLLVSCKSTEVDVNGSLGGTVRDSNTNKPIDNCLVSIKNSNLSARTNADGVYSFGEMDMGRYTLVFKATNYQEYENSVDVQFGARTQKDVFLNKMGTPEVLTAPASNIVYNAATINANVIRNGGAEIEECGFYWGKTSTEMNKVSSPTGSSFSYDLNNLESNCRYFYKAYAKNAFGEGVGDVVYFTTDVSEEARVETKAASDITGVSATIHALITSVPKSGVTSMGFYYGTDKDKLNKKETVVNTGSTSFACNLTGLNGNTSYYYRAFVECNDSEVYGSICSFQTLEIVKPTVYSIDATLITETSATLNGKLASIGNDPDIEYGFCYGTSERNMNFYEVGRGEASSFSLDITGLRKRTTYYFRSYAKNKKGTAYGTYLSFTTPNFNGHEFVDLGLPSGTKWAKYNIGAKGLYQTGDYYSWASSLSSFVDIASTKWGGTWQMPSKEDVEELIKYCTKKHLTQSNNGTTLSWEEWKGPNGNVMILPDGGFYNGTYHQNPKIGYYWTSTPGENVAGNPYKAQKAYLLEGTSLTDLYPIDYKANIRPVSK